MQKFHQTKEGYVPIYLDLKLYASYISTNGDR